jgi:hypothetical protein
VVVAPSGGRVRSVTAQNVMFSQRDGTWLHSNKLISPARIGALRWS